MLIPDAFSLQWFSINRQTLIMLKRIALFIPIIILSACLEESSEKLDKKAFTKIYDNSEFYSSFYAIDMKQTADGGYLILAGKTEVVKEAGEPQQVNTPFSVYLLKVDAFGKIERELELDEEYEYPIGSLNEAGGSYYFFCMDVGKNALMVNVNELADFSIVTPIGENIRLPLASSSDGSELLLLSYDNDTQESVVSRVSLTGTIPENGSARFSSGSPESPIDGLVVAHATRQGTQFPFAVGKTPSGQTYFNGFRDHTFSLAFITFGDPATITDFINGHQHNAGFSSVLPVTGQIFAVSTFSFGFNSLLPNADITTAENVTDVQALAYSLPELESNARVKSIRAVLDGKNVIIYGSNTKSGQIGLYIYDEATGIFLSGKYLGYSNPFEIAALVQTAEGDIVVSGTTYIAGRLPRLCLIKVPKNEIKD
jgi:hypothetical protein